MKNHFATLALLGFVAASGIVSEARAERQGIRLGRTDNHAGRVCRTRANREHNHLARAERAADADRLLRDEDSARDETAARAAEAGRQGWEERVANGRRAARAAYVEKAARAARDALNLRGVSRTNLATVRQRTGPQQLTNRFASWSVT